LAWEQRIKFIQKAFETFDKCRYPVLVGVDGYCIGGGKQIFLRPLAIDLISSCDICYCTRAAKFSIKEVDLAIVADLGT
jgi:enoyl-CoA hydratase/carnithine racemase